MATNSENIKKTHQNYYLTGNYESFIETLYLPEGTNGTAMKIEFLNSYESNIVALREINVLYDRSMELELLYNKIKEEMNYLLAKGN